MIQLGIVGNGFQQCMVAGMVLKLSIFFVDGRHTGGVTKVFKKRESSKDL